MRFELVDPPKQLARIRVIGLGSSGINTVNRMLESRLESVEFIAVNTDKQALDRSSAGLKIQIGQELTQGQGAGGDSAVGRQAAEEDISIVREITDQSDLVFITTGLGGGTGTGAAPVIAKMAKDNGALVVAVVTKPLYLEGKGKCMNADTGVEELKAAVDSLIVIPNEQLIEDAPSDISMQDMYRYADSALYDVVRGIYDQVMKPHQHNFDFTDVRSMMANNGDAMLGIGSASGDNRAEDATLKALNSALLGGNVIENSQNVLLSLVGTSVSLKETKKAISIVAETTGEQSDIVFGYGIDETMGDEIKATVIATGFKSANSELPVTEIIEEPLAVPEVEIVGSAGLKEMAAASGAVDDSVPEELLIDIPEKVNQTSMRFTLVEDSNVEPEEEPIVDTSAVSEEVPPLDIQPTKQARPVARSMNPFDDFEEDNRKAAFRSDELISDLNEPAYTRKYQE